MYYKQNILKNMKKSHIIHNSAKNVEKIHKMVYNEIRIVVVNMKKLIKMIYIILIVLTLTMCFQMINNKVCATEIVDADGYELTEEDTTELFEKANVIATIIRSIGVVVSVLALMIIGLRAMVGSAEEKADYKKSLPGYLFGAIMVLAISLIPSVIYQVMQ